MRLALALFLTVAPFSALQAQYQKLSGSEKEISEYIDEYARCKVLFDKQSARNLVLSDTPNEHLERRFSDIYTTRPLAWVAGCNRLTIRNGMAFRLQPNMFRAALARHLVLADMKVAPTTLTDRPGLSHQVPKLPLGLTADQAAKPANRKQTALAHQYAIDTSAAWLSHYGECVVRGDPTASYRLVTSAPGEQAERSAFSGLKASLASCLLEGEETKLGRDVLRGAIAISLYRLSMAKPSTTGVLK